MDCIRERIGWRVISLGANILGTDVYGMSGVLLSMVVCCDFGPKALVCLGATSAKYLLGDMKLRITRGRGVWREYRGVVLARMGFG